MKKSRAILTILVSVIISTIIALIVWKLNKGRIRCETEWYGVSMVMPIRGHKKSESHYYLDDNGNKINHGSYLLYRGDGSVMVKGNYYRGQKDGTWIQYGADGTIENEENYDHGRRIK